MKATAVILGLLAALFGYLFFQKSSALTATEARLATNELALTNQFKQFQTELMLTNLTAGDVRSNLQHIVDVRTAHLNIFSNRLVQANLLLQTAQEETRAAQAEAQSQAASNAVLLARQDDLARQMSAQMRLQAQLEAARVQTMATAGERDGLAAELQALRVENAELMRSLGDPAFLRTQLEKAQELVALRKKATARSLSPNDRRLPLELQPDGTVRPVPVAQPQP